MCQPSLPLSLQRQPAFDTLDGSLLSVFPPLNEEQTLQEVPTGLDSISHDSTNCELPLLTPCSKAVMSQALKATFSGFKKEQCRLGIPKNPWLWTEQQVCQWLLWATNEFSLVDVNLQRFGMTGQVLCNLGKERFLELAPDFVGDILWEHLEQMIKENQEKTEEQYEENSPLNSVPQWINSNSLGFGVEQTPYGVQTQNYPKGSLLDSLCPASSAPSTLGPEQDFQMFPKARLSTVSVNYCSVSQDFASSSLNLLSSGAGKPGDHDAPENGADSFESSESLLQSWTSQSSLLDVQRVPSFESFEDDCSQSLCLNKPTMSFKDYIQERSDPVEQGKPVIPAAVLAGFTGGPPVGQEEKQAQDELREAEPRSALLLRQKHHPQDLGQALRVPLRVRPPEPAGVHARGAARHPGRPAGHGGLRPPGAVLTHLTRTLNGGIDASGKVSKKQWPYFIRNGGPSPKAAGVLASKAC
uniref:PNT domain-containing protein n=1 Tax=Sus scrofa TaxID=9823 RepID=A0A8D1T6R3_PIG